MESSNSPQKLGFQPHIEGLRAVAVLAVVAHHIGLLDRGFLGVDAFFVISGFLISSLIYDDIKEFQNVRLVHFYSRRARRILPMASLVIVVSLLVVAMLGNPIQTAKAALEGIWASLFAANFYYLQTSTDYFAASDFNLLRHYWSLAVEEQFYIVWPLLLLIIAKISKLAWQRIILYTTLVISITSFVYAYSIGNQNPTSAYFLTLGRVWELSLGALIAIALHFGSAKVIPSYLKYGLTIALVLSFFIPINSFIPALQALPVVLLTAAVIYFGINQKNILFNNTYMNRIGSRSYGWYLWHWPLLVIAELYLKEAPTLLQAFTIVVVAYLLAEISFFLFENPIRHNLKLKSNPFNAIRAGIGFIFTALILSLVLNSSQISSASGIDPKPSSTNSEVVNSPTPDATSSTEESATPSETTSEPQASPTDTPNNGPVVQKLVGDLMGNSFNEYLANLQNVIQGAVSADEYPAKMIPRLGDIVRDRSEWFENGCSVDFPDTNVPECVGGQIGASKTLVLYGDSHATMWMPAFDRIGKDLGWEIHLFAKLACPLVEENVWSYQLNKPFFECQTWQSTVLNKIRDLNPDVIVATDQWKPAVKNGSIDDNGVEALWNRSFQPAVAKLKSYTNRLIVLGNVPNIEADPATCVGQGGSSPWQCSTLRDDSEYAAINRIERKATQAVGGKYIDTMEWACTVQFCPTVIGGRVAYFDRWHFSDTYVKWLDPVLKAALNL